MSVRQRELTFARLMDARMALECGNEQRFVESMAQSRAKTIGTDAIDREKRIDTILADLLAKGIDREKVLLILREGDQIAYKQYFLLFRKQMVKEASPIPDPIIDELRRVVKIIEEKLAEEIRPSRTTPWGGSGRRSGRGSVRRSVTVGDPLWDELLNNVYLSASKIIEKHEFLDDYLKKPLPKLENQGPGGHRDAWDSKDQRFTIWTGIASDLFELIGVGSLSPFNKELREEGNLERVKRRRAVLQAICDLMNGWFVYSELNFNTRMMESRLQDRS